MVYAVAQTGATSSSNESEGAALRNGNSSNNNNAGGTGTGTGTGGGNNPFGRLAPAVSVGGNPLGRHGSGRFSYDLDLEDGAGARGGEGVEDMVEHDYGDTGGQAEVCRAVDRGGGGRLETMRKGCSKRESVRDRGNSRLVSY